MPLDAVKRRRGSIGYVRKMQYRAQFWCQKYGISLNYQLDRPCKRLDYMFRWHKENLR
jgi:hypothetical protein